VADSESRLSSPLGRITISSGVVAQIVARAAAECPGVVGMAARGRERVVRLLPRARALQGISVSRNGNGVEIDLRVVVEHGLNLAEVAASVRSRVAYEVERLTGLQIASIDVHIEDVRRTA
jgi:uncharacterized alkaline shock family protein YloU